MVPGRRSKFTYDDDLVLLREGAACKAHIAPTGEARERFEIAASKSNATKKLSSRVTWKALQDHYKRLQSKHDDDNRVQRRMSVIGGEVSEIEELLSVMKEDRGDRAAEKNAKREKEEKREREKERLGAVIRARATGRQSTEEDETPSGGSEREKAGSRTRKRRSPLQKWMRRWLLWKRWRRGTSVGCISRTKRSIWLECNLKRTAKSAKGHERKERRSGSHLQHWD